MRTEDSRAVIRIKTRELARQFRELTTRLTALRGEIAELADDNDDDPIPRFNALHRGLSSALAQTRTVFEGASYADGVAEEIRCGTAHVDMVRSGTTRLEREIDCATRRTAAAVLYGRLFDETETDVETTTRLAGRADALAVLRGYWTKSTSTAAVTPDPSALRTLLQDCSSNGEAAIAATDPVVFRAAVSSEEVRAHLQVLSRSFDHRSELRAYARRLIGDDAAVTDLVRTNREKTGVQRLGVGEAGPAISAKLPPSRIRWGFLELDPHSHAWVPRQAAVDELATNLRERLQVPAPARQLVREYNAAVGYLVRGLAPLTALDVAHLDRLHSPLRAVHAELCGGVITVVRERLATRGIPSFAIWLRHFLTDGSTGPSPQAASGSTIRRACSRARVLPSRAGNHRLYRRTKKAPTTTILAPTPFGSMRTSCVRLPTCASRRQRLHPRWRGASILAVASGDARAEPRRDLRDAPLLANRGRSCRPDRWCVITTVSSSRQRKKR